MGLLTAVLVAMFHFAHRALKDESMGIAKQTLESTVQQIDNVLLNVEKSAGMVYMEMLSHLDDPQSLYSYSRRAVESCPYIDGCAIALKPDYYPGSRLFMSYIHRKGHTKGMQNVMVVQDKFTDRPYTEQRWYKEPMKSGRCVWIDPLKNDEAEGDPLASFCLPVYDKSKECVGVMAVDIRIELLSDIVLKTKPSANGYAVLLAGNGSFIVHPNEDKLQRQTVFAQMLEGADASVEDVAEAMLNGEEGEKPFFMDGELWHVFYKPFSREEVPGRAMEPLTWSVGVVYPVDDIFGDYNRLFNMMMIGALTALLVLFGLCWIVINRQLAPLETLTYKARRIAEGHYDEPLPEITREDEIGQLQQNFGMSLTTLTAFMSRQQSLNETLKERGEVLAEAYSQVQKNNQVKISFLHNMTNQMAAPAMDIAKSVVELCDNFGEMSIEDKSREAGVIERQSKAIVDITDQMLATAQNTEGKEEGL